LNKFDTTKGTVCPDDFQNGCQGKFGKSKRLTAIFALRRAVIRGFAETRPADSIAPTGCAGPTGSACMQSHSSQSLKRKTLGKLPKN